MAQSNPEEMPTGPTTLRVIVGTYLRKLRESSGVSRDEAAYEIRASPSKISRMELGRVSFRLRDVRDLMTMYGIQEEAELDRVEDLAREANRPSRWRPYNDFLPDFFTNYLEMEGAATLIRTYEVQLVPGLLQTEEYARSVMMLGYGHTPLQEIDKRIEARMRRKEILVREEARPELWAIIDEASLHRPFGGTAVMRGQIQYLIDACERPNVRLQVMPFAWGNHAGAGAPFTYLRFAYQELNDVVYMEHLTGGLYLERDHELDAYRAAFDHLSTQGTQPRDTPDFLSRVLRERYS